MKNLVKHPLILAAIIAVFHVVAARANTAIIFDTSQFWSISTGTGVYGWQFAAQSSLEVSSLGLYDDAGNLAGGFPGNGLLESHDIAIWDVSNPSSPLVSSIIPAGTVAPLENGFRYVTISPVELLAGHDYVIAATYATHDWFTGALNNPSFVATIAPQITFEGYRENTSTTLAYPGGFQSGLLEGIGPNFTFTVLPEPTVLTFTGLAAAMLFGSSKTLRRCRTNAKGVEPRSPSVRC